MSDFQFSLELVDKISGPADAAKSHLEKMKSTAEKAGKTLDYGDRAKRAAEELARIKLDPKGFLAARDAMKHLREEQQKLIRQHEGGFKKLFAWVTPYGFGRLGSNILGNLASDAIEKIPESLMAGAEKAVDIIKEGVAKAFEVGGKEEHLRGSFKYLFGGPAGAREALEQADRFSKLLPFGGQKTAGYIGELGKAGIKGNSAAASLALAADVGAMSPSGEGTDEALFALERLKRHGEFSPRLAEGLNINLTDFYAAIGRKLNVSAAEAQKQLGDSGKVGFSTILNTLMEIHSRSIGAPTGSVALEQSKELMQRWARIKELPEEYLRSISTSPGWNRLSDTLGRVLDQLDPNKHPEIVNGMLDAFDNLAHQAENFLRPENVKKFTDALANIPDTLKSIADGLDTVVKVSETLGILWAGSKFAAALAALAKILPAVGTVAGTAVRTGGAAVASGAVETAGVAALPFLGSDNPQAADEMKRKNDALVQSGQRIEHSHFFGLLKTYEDVPARPGTPSTPKQQINITVPQINVAVQTKQDDVNHTGQQVGVEVHRATTQALERAAQEAGAT